MSSCHYVQLCTVTHLGTTNNISSPQVNQAPWENLISRGGTDSPKMTKNQKCQCYQSFLGSVLYLKTGGDFSFCQKVRLTPCTGGPKILTVFGIFIDSGPLGEKQIDEQNGFILVVAVLFLQTDPQTAPRQHRRSLDTLQTPSRHPQDTLQTPSIANRRIKTSFYTLNLFQLLLGGGLN